MPNQGGTHEQHVKAGQQSNKNAGDKQQERQAAPGKKDDAQNRGGSGNFAQDRERASEAGRKGGKN